MGRKPKIKTENNISLVLRDPELFEKDSSATSALFFERHLAIKSETRKWSLLQQTLFIIVLGRLKDWKKGNNDNTVVLNNENVMRELGWDFNKENKKRIGSILRNEFTYMVSHSTIRLQDAVTKKWVTSNLITDAEGDTNITRVTINPKFMNHFEDLFYLGTNFKQSFLPFMEPDFTSFKSKHSYLLFADLRQRCEVKNKPVEFTVSYGIEDLKELFELKAKDYMRKDKKTGKLQKFDYPSFEKNVLNKAVDEINETEQIKVLPWEDGKFFEKEKLDRRVNKYIFKVRVNDLETIKNQRIQLLETAKRAGLSVEFYPNFKETFVVSPEWKGQWRVDEATVKDLKDESTESMKRNDKIASKAQMMFDLNSVKNNEEPVERSITKEQLIKMIESNNKDFISN